MSLTSTFKSEIKEKNYPKWNQFLKKIKDIQFVSVNSQEQRVKQVSS
jgi:hypothetical protein